MNRLKPIIKKAGTRGQFYKYIKYPEVPLSFDDIYVITKREDRLDLLANQFYGDATFWWYIARANNLNSMVIPENIQLRIPGTLDYIQGQ